MKNNIIQKNSHITLTCMAVLTIIISILFMCAPARAQENVKLHASGGVNVSINNVNKDTIYNIIDGAHHITGSDVDFYVCDKNNYIYRFKDGSLSLLSNAYTNLVDMHLFADYLYILTPSTLVKYNPHTNLSETILSDNILNPTSLCVIENGYYIATLNQILFINNQNLNIVSVGSYVLDMQAQNFASTIDIVVLENKTLAVLHFDTDVMLSTFSLTPDFSTIVHSSTERISTNISTNYSINAMANDILLSYANAIYKLDNFTISNEPLIEAKPSSTSFKSGEIKSINSFCVYGNKIIICDNHTTTQSVQSFIIENESISFDKLLIASAGADIDRLYNPKDIAITQDNSLLIVDNGNQRIVKNNLNNDENSVIIDLVAPEKIVCSADGDIFVLSGDVLSKYINIYSSTQQKINVSQGVIDIEITLKNQMFLLDEQAKQLLVLDENSTSNALNLEEVTFCEHTKLKSACNADKLFLLANGTIYCIDLTKQTLELSTVVNILTGTIIDFATDYLGNIYTLSLVNNAYSIDKYSSAGVKISSVTLSGANYSCLELDWVSGFLYIIDSAYHKVIEVKITNFINALALFETDYSFQEDYPNKNGAIFAKVKNDCYASKYPFNIEKIQALKQDDMVIVINLHTEINANYAYILIADKEYLNILAYVDTSLLDLDIQEVMPEFDEIVITAPNGAYLYYFPCGGKFQNGLTCSIDGFYARQGDKFTIFGTACGYKDYSSQVGFYTVKLSNGAIAYIKAFCAQDSEVLKPTVSLQSDARVEKILNTDMIYVYTYDEQSNTYTATDITLENGQYIQLMDKFDSNAMYHHIKYQNGQDGKLSEGYVQTKFIVYQDISWLQIVGIVLLAIAIIFICISAPLVYSFIKKKGSI